MTTCGGHTTDVMQVVLKDFGEESLACARLKNVVPRFDVCDVDPLAVNVVAIQIPAAHSDALVTKVCTFVPLRNTCLTQTTHLLKFCPQAQPRPVPRMLCPNT